MRIDKYLWCVRLYKTRALAQDALRLGRVRIHGQHTKASYELKIGEQFTIHHPPFDFTYCVLAFPKGRLAASLVAEFLQNQTPEETITALHSLRLASGIVRDRGSGRPSKRDRRELIEYIDTLFDNDDDAILDDTENEDSVEETTPYI